MSINIEASVKTPSMNMDEVLESISIVDISIPEDLPELYFSLMKTIERYRIGAPEKIDPLVNWFFEKDDEDLEKVGQKFKFFFRILISIRAL